MKQCNYAVKYRHQVIWFKGSLTFTCCKKASSYIAQYPVLRTVQSALHFTSLTDLFTQTPSRLLWEASRHMLQLMREDCSYTYPPLSIARYSFIQLSELEQCRVKKLVQGFNTAAQDSNPGSRSRESEALPLSHCALLQMVYGSMMHRTIVKHVYVCVMYIWGNSYAFLIVGMHTGCQTISD